MTSTLQGHVALKNMLSLLSIISPLVDLAKVSCGSEDYKPLRVHFLTQGEAIPSVY